MSKLATIYGGSGFLGRYIARRLGKQGWRVRVACRRPNEAGFVRPYGTPGQVEPVFCNIRDDASVDAAMAGSDVVINCVGTFDKSGRNSFDAIQHEGAARIARLAAVRGVARMVHVSAIGADADSDSVYFQTKAKGEAAVLQHMPGAVILRPSVMFGPEDGFFNKFAGMSRLGPVLPLVGGESRMQPVYVDDVAAAAVKAATGEAAPGVYELGGPEVGTLRDLTRRMLSEVHRRRAVINLPFWVGGLIGGALDLASAATLGLVSNAILTGDQVKALRSDIVVGDGARGLSDLGIVPTDMASVIPGYLWRYRPSGQYLEIKESARRLGKS